MPSLSKSRQRKMALTKRGPLRTARPSENWRRYSKKAVEGWAGVRIVPSPIGAFSRATLADPPCTQADAEGRARQFFLTKAKAPPALVLQRRHQGWMTVLLHPELVEGEQRGGEGREASKVTYNCIIGPSTMYSTLFPSSFFSHAFPVISSSRLPLDLFTSHRS
jgi:hypothetical protein